MPESVDSLPAAPVPRGARALVLGFRTALVLWVLAFVGRLSPTFVPSPLLATALALGILGGGAAAGRLPRAGAAGGAAVGLVAAVISLLLFGSLLSSEHAGGVVPSAALWIPGFLLAGALLGALGAAIARAALPQFAAEPDWNARLARVAAAGTLALLAVGGLVTSRDAGLAVVDWPNSYGYNMFLYPLSKMTGDIFYEHSHRLFGSLVGLTTLALFVRLAATERRGWVRGVAGAALVLVVAQGILGGLRVTGHFTTSTSPDVVRPSLGLAVVHGVVGQLFFALMASLAVFTSPTWKRAARADRAVRGDARVAESGGSSDATFTLLLVGAIVLQLLLGVNVRHLGQGLMVHMTFSIVVVVLAVITSIRLLVLAPRGPVFRRSGIALLSLTGAQFLLGIAAFVTASSPGLAGAVFPTLHQTVGALLLASAVVAHLWCRRLLATVDAAPASEALLAPPSRH